MARGRAQTLAAAGAPRRAVRATARGSAAARARRGRLLLALAPAGRLRASVRAFVAAYDVVICPVTAGPRRRTAARPATRARSSHISSSTSRTRSALPGCRSRSCRVGTDARAADRRAGRRRRLPRRVALAGRLAARAGARRLRAAGARRCWWAMTDERADPPSPRRCRSATAESTRCAARTLGVYAGRGPRAGRRERLGQVDAAEDPLGSAPARRRRDRPRRPQPTAFRNPTDALRQGIATVTQETTLAPDLSIAENVFLGHRMATTRAASIDWRGTRRAGARGARATRPRSRPFDARAPAAPRPAADGRDRPRALDRRTGPDPRRADELAHRRRGRVAVRGRPPAPRASGVATIFVSHRLNEVFELADRITVLRDGHTVGGGERVRVRPAAARST